VLAFVGVSYFVATVSSVNTRGMCERLKYSFYTIPIRQCTMGYANMRGQPGTRECRAAFLRCDLRFWLIGGAAQTACYAAGCACFGQTCNDPLCCGGTAKLAKRDAYEYSCTQM
jgi:hypothetical protein